MVAFRGEVQSVAALLDAARAAPETMAGAGVGVRHTAAQSARTCRELLAEGRGLDVCWRFGILQTLDDYTSSLRRGGPAVAAGVFTEEPTRTGADQIDAAFAALAAHLAERDGWQAPAWAQDATRHTSAWYPCVPAIFYADADAESPSAFRQRGILITSRSLARA